MRDFILCLLLGSQLVACGDGPKSPSDLPGDDPPPAIPADLTVLPVVQGADDPVHMATPPGDERLFVVERPGRIRIVEEGRLQDPPFLDIRPQVSTGGERGLLSVAFHPRYPDNGHFYVYYTDPAGDSRVVRFTAPPGEGPVDPATAVTLLEVEQPFGNHNGGHVLFGPDGMLYIGLGDGGSAGDPLGHGQDRGTLLGALLRVDVDGGDPYSVPVDNPFVGDPSARDEIWAFGLRNPWRLSFDSTAGIFYVADVGQNRWEEINAVPLDEAGHNYGWNVMEGKECFGSGSCDAGGLTLPVLAYRTGPEGCAVIGGHVYRGAAIPGIRGHYFFSDWCGGWLRSFRLEDGEAADLLEWDVGDIGRVVSFGLDTAGELYLLSQEGTLYRIVPRE